MIQHVAEKYHPDIASELQFECVDRAPEHPLMRGRARSLEICLRACQRQLKSRAFRRAFTLVRRERPTQCDGSFSFDLLILDVLALEAAGHTVFYRHGRFGPEHRRASWTI